MTFAANTSGLTAAAAAIRRRHDRRRPSSPALSGTARLRRAAAAENPPRGDPPAWSALVDAVAALVLAELRPELRRLEQHIASVALAQAGRKEHA